MGWLFLSPLVEGKQLVNVHLLSSRGYQTWCWLLLGRQEWKTSHDFQDSLSDGGSTHSPDLQSLLSDGGKGSQPLPLSSMSVCLGEVKGSFLARVGVQMPPGPRPLRWTTECVQMVGEDMVQR